MALAARFRRRTRRAPELADDILDVVAATVDKMSSLTRSVLRRPLIAQLERPDPHFELIVDNVMVANWRLEPVDGTGVRLAACHPHPSLEMIAAEAAANERIAGILTEARTV